MTFEQVSTTDLAEESDVDDRSTIEEAVGGEWHRVDGMQAHEGELGVGMCDLRVERTPDGWVAKLASVNLPTRRETRGCADLSATLAKLRSLIRDHGHRLQDRSNQLTALVTGGDEPAS